MLSMIEPTLADGVQAIHRQGWYMTFAYTWGAPESFTSGTELFRRFVRHTLKQAVQHHVAEQLRPRCERILAESRDRGCLFFSCNDRRDAIVLTFNNGVDMQYARSLGPCPVMEEVRRISRLGLPEGRCTEFLSVSGGYSAAVLRRSPPSQQARRSSQTCIAACRRSFGKLL